MTKVSDSAILMHMIDAINEIIEFTKNDKQVFYNNKIVKRAVSKDFEIIGEAAGRLSDGFKQQYKNVPWQKLKDFRNVLVHDYFDIDYETMWQIIEEKLPELKTQIEQIIEEQK